MMDRKYIKNFLSFALLFLATFLFGQQSNNPFDISTRKDKNAEPTIEQVEEIPEVIEQENIIDSIEVQEATTIPPEINNAPNRENNSNNPFDIERLKPGQKRTSPPQVKPPNKSNENSPKTQLGPKIDIPITGNFKFFMSTTLIVLLTLSVALYSSYITKVYRAFINENFLKMIHRDHGTVAIIPYFILYGLFFISLGIFLFLVFKYFNISIFSNTIGGLLTYIASVAAIFLTKHFLLNMIGFVFPINKEVKQYSFTVIIFSIILGLFLIPANILIAHAPSSMTSFLIYGTFVVILLLYLFRILRSLFIASRFITLYKFHFFMYLCTLEIAPVLILLKIVLSTTMEF